MATPFAAANWKMHLTVAEAVALAEAMRGGLAPLTGATRVVCPPFTALAAVASALEGSGVEVGAQNMHPEASGAFTGEISGAMVRDLCGYVIVGHSERRHGYGEDDALIARKVTAAVSAGLEVVLCVGETLAEREAGSAEQVVERQLRAALGGRDAAQLQRITLAYEPVWAIGTGRTASAEDAGDMHRAARAVVAKLAGSAAARDLVIQYGGSVKPDNAPALLACDDVDGLLVGGASLDADSFARIVAAAATA